MNGFDPGGDLLACRDEIYYIGTVEQRHTNCLVWIVHLNY
jgi:hypothetical protein